MIEIKHLAKTFNVGEPTEVVALEDVTISINKNDFLVIVGSIITLLSFFRYKQTAKQLNEGTYSHSSILITMITSIIILVSLLLIVYLTKSI